MKHYQYWEHIAKNLSGESTEEELSDLKAWLNESVENRRLYDEVKHHWLQKRRELSPQVLERGKARVFKKIAADREADRLDLPLTNKPWWQPYALVGQVAAALLLLAMCWYWYPAVVRPQQTITFKKIENLGKPRVIQLPDGSKVWLNAASNIRYDANFQGDTRNVYLEGEAFFDVQRNEDKPFIVHAGAVSTRVLGTSFNIKAYPDQTDIEVTVTSGKVSVVDATGVIGELIENQQIAYQKASGKSTRQLVLGRQMQEWKDGRLVFDAVSFKTVAETLSHRFQVSISFKSINIENCPVTAQFDGEESLEQILYMVGMVTDSKYEYQNEKEILIYGKGCIQPPKK